MEEDKGEKGERVREKRGGREEGRGKKRKKEEREGRSCSSRVQRRGAMRLDVEKREDERRDQKEGVDKKGKKEGRR